jgi:hypothetical protein
MKIFHFLIFLKKVDAKFLRNLRFSKKHNTKRVGGRAERAPAPVKVAKIVAPVKAAAPVKQAKPAVAKKFKILFNILKSNLTFSFFYF